MWQFFIIFFHFHFSLLLPYIPFSDQWGFVALTHWLASCERLVAQEEEEYKRK